VSYISLLIFVVVIIALFAFSARARRRQAAAQAEMTERIGVGTDVMTTSGLHGTVVAKYDDGTVSLSIAPGVEVRWELAALRDANALPDRYRRDGGAATAATTAGTDPAGTDPAGTDPAGTLDAPGTAVAPEVDLRKDR
jgi:preprotein translocase subunit YajC